MPTKGQTEPASVRGLWRGLGLVLIDVKGPDLLCHRLCQMLTLQPSLPKKSQHSKKVVTSITCDLATLVANLMLRLIPQQPIHQPYTL